MGEYTFWMSNYLFILVFFCCANLIVYFVQELYHMVEGVPEDDTSLVFNNFAQKVIKDTIKHSRYQSITYCYRRELRQPMNTVPLDMFRKSREWYDTCTPILQVLCITFVYNI
jgi:hypothetical protein